MKSRVLATSLLLTLLLQGCATNQPKLDKYYSKSEYTKLTYCVALADTVHFVALQKLRKKPQEELIEAYKKRKNSELNIATVKKVYNEEFTNSWDYTVKFYDTCGMKLADMDATRIRFASYCHQNALIAGLASIYKKIGEPKEKLYKIYEKSKSTAPLKIIDRVYAGDKSHAESKLSEWQLCMSEISETK
ncbi:MAG: hypothetical protein OEZ39_16450 [Gammaproteobacteria bacterium]|nr:hypothetical protein [Gammaproteobacteria bacterium]MDH5653451.1 hypothetical protein [Gammaproteobacteria bacterium]